MWKRKRTCPCFFVIYNFNYLTTLSYISGTASLVYLAEHMSWKRRMPILSYFDSHWKFEVTQFHGQCSVLMYMYPIYIFQFDRKYTPKSKWIKMLTYTTKSKTVKHIQVISIGYRLLDSVLVECWLRVREVPGSIPSQGPRHTNDVIKMVPVVPLFSTQHWKWLALSQ